jgi:hypothetical protein
MTRLQRMGHLRVLLFGAGILLALTAGVRTQDYGPIVENVYRSGVVKIDVSSNTPVFRVNKDGENENVCASEGTGFVVNRRTIITAEHVMAIPAECGTPIILIRSRLHKLELLATKTGSKHDVAVLTLTEDLPQRVCSLVLWDLIKWNDFYQQKGVRLGIPGGFPDPLERPIKTSRRDNARGPLVLLELDDNVDPGESGGPVLVAWNVVGILREKYLKITGLSVMIPVNMVQEAMLESKIEKDKLENFCNPSFWSVFQADDGKITGRLSVNETYDPELQAKLAPELLNAFSLVKAESRDWPVEFVLELDRFGGNLQTPPLDPGDKARREDNFRRVEMVLQDVQRSFEVSLWEIMIAEGEKKGLWDRGHARSHPYAPLFY